MPYLPGLDGLRALAVVAVMVYHADSTWLPGGFLGVEVFFVISGYLITALLLAERARTGTVSLRRFWARRARRLLPALLTMLVAVTTYTAVFRRDALGRLRGDIFAGLTYGSNWYQIWVGQGYTATGDFAPLRHLWSLAVEGQFYVVWPLVVVALVGAGHRRARRPWVLRRRDPVTGVRQRARPGARLGGRRPSRRRRRRQPRHERADRRRRSAADDGRAGRDPRVVFVTVHAERSWVPPSNDLIRSLPASHPNVRVVDWAVHAPSCPGACFFADGIHLQADGRRYFAQLVVEALA